MKYRLLKIGIVLAMILVCSGLLGCVWLFELLFYLAVGWASYLFRVVPEMQVSWSGVATAVVCLSLLAVGLHRFLRWLYAARHQEAPAPQWPMRWTAAILGVVVLMFVSGIAVVGVTHQTAWLVTSPEPVFDGGIRKVSARIEAGNDLHQLCIAMHNYNATMGHLPPHAVFGPDGQPLLSWRVLVLPFVEENQLYSEFHLDEPWDSPHNLRLLPRMPRVYAPVPRKRWDRERGHATFYQVFVGPGAAFEGRKRMKMPDDFPDGKANTILIVEAATAVPWTKPADVPYSPDAPVPPLGAQFPKRFLAVMADGSVWTPNKERLSEATLRAAITRDAGDTLGPDWE